MLIGFLKPSGCQPGGFYFDHFGEVTEMVLKKLKILIIM
nr:MAG TPA: hypothetical protein [Caudoviricetes sp.]DAO06762.1 MAG TPA: hypothetical protein [Caudoviricetes sp.]DAO57164.1 MAG TPA: hypothetical protein [Caudoviricetes sp.]DAW76928.1 MAG TPA: hypothetical protein [Caudoviricetes sp.]